jgi:hypothetical protein
MLRLHKRTNRLSITSLVIAYSPRLHYGTATKAYIYALLPSSLIDLPTLHHPYSSLTTLNGPQQVHFELKRDSLHSNMAEQRYWPACHASHSAVKLAKAKEVTVGHKERLNVPSTKHPSIYRLLNALIYSCGLLAFKDELYP